MEISTPAIDAERRTWRRSRATAGGCHEPPRAAL